jgi:phosphoribosylanthranilate isomerase
VAKIKICGLFREADIEFANEAGPDFIGFVFAESRRRVSPGEAARLRSRLREGIVPVGVFVNAPAEEIAALYRDGLIAVAQLHGEEDAAYIRRLKTLSAAGGQPPVPVIKTLRVTGPVEAAALEAPAADYLLLDSGSGSGQAFDWTLLANWNAAVGNKVKAEHDRENALPWFLAGGISLENIGRALSYRPFGIDVSSGAETGGVKDREKMIALVRRAREAVYG